MRIVGSDDTSASDVEWRVAPGPVSYSEAVAEMEGRARAVAEGSAPELVWLLEHPPVITAGTSADPDDLIDPGRFPVVQSGRGGRLAYHGPGQRLVYVVLDLGRRGRDVRGFVRALEAWGIAALGKLGIEARRSPRGTGIWVARGDGSEAKIGAIGVRIRRWVSLHGMAINVAPDLSAFEAIVPCGIRDAGVTRLVDLDPRLSMRDLDAALRQTFCPVFGPRCAYPVPRPGVPVLLERDLPTV